jgi:multiple sugar transport system substrate-binding protein
MPTIAQARSRWSVVIAVLVLVLGLLTACGGGDTEAPAATVAPAGGVGETQDQATPADAAVDATPEAPADDTAAPAPAAEGTIRVAVVRGAMSETMRPLASEYEQANPGVRVTVEEEPEGGAFEALIAAGNQPDIIVVSFGPQIGTYAAQEAVVPLDDMPGAQELFDRLEPATVEQIYGHHYYVPIGADVTMMLYNKELFEEAGLDPEDPPATWDEFLAAAEAISALPARDNGSPTYGAVFWNDALAWGGWYWNMLQPMYLNANQAQCQLLNRLGNDIVFDRPECGLAEFFAFNQAAQEFAPPTMEQNFFSRSIGMWPQYGYSWEPNLETAEGRPMVIGEDVGVAPVPVPNEGDTSYTTYGGRALMIMRTTPERQAMAWDFIQFLMEEENNLRFITELGYLPVITSLKEDPYFQDPARQPFIEALENGVLPQQFASVDPVANQLLGVYQQAAVEGAISPEEAVETAAQEARAALDELQ